jgi:4'-phosphopantetheinyl transferase
MANTILIRLWRFHFDDPTHTDVYTILSADERQRAERLKIPIVRQRFINGRVLLRQTLAAQLNIEPDALQFEYSDSGKPYLAKTPLHFNFSHSEDCALLAIAGVPVGVDVEAKRASTALSSMETTMFAASERSYLNQFNDPERDTAFFRLWTCKEALVKATGEGFQAILRYQIRFEEDAASALNASDNAIPWLIQSFELDERFTGAVAVACDDSSQVIEIQHMPQSG